LHQPEISGKIKRINYSSQSEQWKHEKTTNVTKTEAGKIGSQSGGLEETRCGLRRLRTEMGRNHGAESSRYKTASARVSIEGTVAVAETWILRVVDRCPGLD
jgi:hypothetical protein